MKLSFIEQNEYLVLVILEGHIGAFDASTLSDRLEDSVARGYINFVIDLSKVVFMDSVSLTLLIKLLKDMQILGGTVKLVEPESSTIKRILYITKFDHVFNIYKTASEALVSF